MTHPLLDPRYAHAATALPPAAAGPAGGILSLPDDEAPRWAELSALERSALQRDDLAVPLLGGICSPRLLPVTRADRARAIRAVVPEAVLEHAVLHRTTAAWFLSCCPAPQRLHLMVHRQRRTTTRPVDPQLEGLAWEVRQLVHEPPDVDRLHGLQVTTPLRTAADLACWEDPTAVPALEQLLEAPHLGVEPQAVTDLLRQRSRLPDRRRGMVTLRSACRRLGLVVPR